MSRVRYRMCPGSRSFLWRVHHGDHRDRSADTQRAHHQSEARVPGRLRRVDARRHGRVHLCAGARPRVDRAAARVGHSGHACDHRLLGQHPVCDVPPGLGLLDGLGADWRPHRTGARADVDDSRLFDLHVHVRTRDQYLAAGRAPHPVRHRPRGRAADWIHVRRRRTAGRSPQDGGRRPAHRLLCRVLPGVARQLLHRGHLRVALDVLLWRRAGALHLLHPLGRQGIAALAPAVRRRSTSSGRR